MRLPIAIAVITCLALAACNSGGNDARNAQQPVPSAGGQNTATAMNAPLQPGQVRVVTQLHGEPQYRADGAALIIPVEIHNGGNATLSSTGAHPVHLGAHAADTSGKVTLVDLARADIPTLLPGGQAIVNLTVPIAQSEGKQIQILPVQEGVNWFDAFGVKPLVIGPFIACDPAGQATVCGSDGKPLAIAAYATAAPAQP